MTDDWRSIETRTAIELRMKLAERHRQLQPFADALQGWINDSRLRLAEAIRDAHGAPPEDGT